MRTMINQATIEGKLVDHDLKVRVTGEQAKTPGIEYISGQINIAIDDTDINTVPVYFNYVTATTKSGKTNQTFVKLKEIAEGGHLDTFVKVNSSALALNEWYNDEEELISTLRCTNGFVSSVRELTEPAGKRAKFEVDMLITGVRRVEENEEKGYPEKVDIIGYIFNFRNDIMPVTLSSLVPAGMDYFESLEASISNPILTKVWGIYNCQTINFEQETTSEAAFGEPYVITTEAQRRTFEIEGAGVEPYDFGDPTVATIEDIQTALQTRESYLADIATRNAEYKAQKAASNNLGAAFDTGSEAIGKMAF